MKRTLPVRSSHHGRGWFFPGKGLSLTFSQAEEMALKLHEWLSKGGFSSPRRMVVVDENSPQVIILRELADLAGDQLIPLSPRYLPRELMAMIAIVSPQLVFAGSEIQLSLPPEIHVVPLPIIEEVLAGRAPKKTSSLFPPQPSSRQILSLPPSRVLPEILFTSGSSGSPRAVVRHPGRMQERIAQTIAHFGCHREEIHIVAAPLYHSGPALFYRVYRSLKAEQWIFPRFDAQALLTILPSLPSKAAIFLVPTMARRFVLLAEEQGIRLSMFQHFICAGGPMDPDTRRRLLRLLPEGTLWEFYGTTETGTITVLPPEKQWSHCHTVGFPLPGVSLYIGGPRGEPLPPGSVGKVFVKTPTMMSGYLGEGAEVLPEEFTSDNYLWTGDLGELTHDGALILHGRGDGVIVTGGVNVQGEEVEKALKELPGVSEAVVFGVSDPEWGEKIVALVEMSSGFNLSGEDLRRLMRGKVAPFKIPKEIRIASIPRTPTGKILKAKEALRNLWAQTSERTGGAEPPNLS